MHRPSLEYLETLTDNTRQYIAWLGGEVERLRAGFRLCLARLDISLPAESRETEIDAYIEAAGAAAKAAEAWPEWVSVTERLPEKSGLYLVHLPSVDGETTYISALCYSVQHGWKDRKSVV